MDVEGPFRVMNPKYLPFQSLQNREINSAVPYALLDTQSPVSSRSWPCPVFLSLVVSDLSITEAQRVSIYLSSYRPKASPGRETTNPSCCDYVLFIYQRVLTLTSRVRRQRIISRIKEGVPWFPVRQASSASDIKLEMLRGKGDSYEDHAHMCNEFVTPS